jgi:hypothetical protein
MQNACEHKNKVCDVDGATNLSNSPSVTQEISLCFITAGYGDLKAADDAESVKLIDIYNLPELAFDHKKIIEVLILVLMEVSL